MNEQPIVGISSEDHKFASLLFERIIPLNSALEIPNEVKFPITPKDENFRKFQVTDGRLRNLVANALLDARKNRDNLDASKIKSLAEEIVKKAENVIASDMHTYLNKQGIPSIPIFHSQQDYDSYLPKGGQETVEISLIKASLIDTTHIEWKSILDIRKDKDFRRKLRNFRLFLNENYQGKSPLYVRDSLEKKVEEYQDACRKHGLKLVLSSISQTLDSKSILGYLGLITVGIITGQQSIIDTTLIGGTVIEIGKMTVQVAQKHLDYLSSRENTELAYLIKLKKGLD